MSRIVVVGAGLAGLSAACHLARAGTTSPWSSGSRSPAAAAAVSSQDGFTFDTGPTVMTMPELIAEALVPRSAPSVDRGPADAPARSGVPGQLRRRQHDRRASRAGRHAGGDRPDLRRAPTRPPSTASSTGCAELYEVEMPNFIDRNFDSRSACSPGRWRRSELVRLGAFGRLGPAVRRRFADPRLQRLFSFQAMYAGLAPEYALALYAVITYMDSDRRRLVPRGRHARGPDRAWPRRGEGRRRRFCSATSVTGLLRSVGRRVAGVRLADGERAGRRRRGLHSRSSDRVRSELLPDLRRREPCARPTYSPSAVVWHVGVRGAPAPAVGHHNIHFGHEWETRLRRAAGPWRADARPVPAGHRSVARRSRRWRRRAARPCTSWSPCRTSPARSTGRPSAAPMRERLHAFLDQQGYPGDIVTDQLVTPLDWQAQGMAAGTPFALAHTFAQTGPFRPPNVERRLPGLFFAGSGTVPGVGVPMVLISGKLAAQRVATYLREAWPVSERVVIRGPACARAIAAARGSPGATARPTSGALPCCPSRSASTSMPSTPSAGWPTTSSIFPTGNTRKTVRKPSLSRARQPVPAP